MERPHVSRPEGALSICLAPSDLATNAATGGFGPARGLRKQLERFLENMEAPESLPGKVSACRVWQKTTYDLIHLRPHTQDQKPDLKVMPSRPTNTSGSPESSPFDNPVPSIQSSARRATGHPHRHAEPP